MRYKTIHPTRLFLSLAGFVAAVAVSTAIYDDPVATNIVAGAVAATNDVGAIAVQAPATAQTALNWDLPNLEHSRVDYWVRQFQTTMRDKFEVFLSRQDRYAPMILEKLEERNMPRDLLYLAMIESGFNPKAYSSAHAAGLWQFIADTGQRYGLEINQAVDERRDPEKSTDAALSYLSDLYDRFDSWYLAAAAYNTGENRVGRIMREVTGSERGEEADYYLIWSRLPRETREYVPMMIAAARIAKEPDKYGFGDVDRLQPFEYQTVTADPATPLETLAKRFGTTVAELKTLNPQLKLDRTRNDEPSAVRVPVRSS